MEKLGLLYNMLLIYMNSIAFLLENIIFVYMLVSIVILFYY